MRDFIPSFIIGAFILVFIVSLCYISAQNEKTWREYQAAHHCVVNGYKAGQSSVGIGIGSKGQTSVVPVYTPEQKIYRCDGDEIIIK